ncbi:MAG: hypothetical protein HOC71_04275 [Candidatus Latescibacteria bacterium]|jgi:3-deoxy-D-manno-octulosonic-acid transferase|nr:hypothetical protein [Candidatus Latescibacterota bacterium]
MIALYTLLMSIVLIAVYPIAWVGALFGHTYLLKRFRAPGDMSESKSHRVWIHAASVGEAGIAFSLASEIKRKHPQFEIYISTVTSTGLARIHSLNELSGESTVTGAFIAPIDHPLITGKFIARVKPSSFILVETELWPWLVQSMHSSGIPITMVNGKLSKRSFRRYMIARSVMKRIVNMISLICVQSRTFAKRFMMLDVPHERIEIIGNVKFDGLPEAADFDSAEIRHDFGIPERAKVFVAGSTRPGEEMELARSFLRILEVRQDTVMVIAPRHLSRMPEVEKVLNDAGLPYWKRSGGEKIVAPGKNVLIIDTMGELVTAFACADAAFVGGSLRDFGGHNPLEPAALGIPMMFGPYMEQTGSKELLSEGAAILVHDGDELSEALNRIFENDEKSRRMSEAGPAVVKRFKGTLARTLKHMENRRLI